jgi:putative ABC transport system permease protein
MDPSGGLAWCRARLRTAPWTAVAFAALVLVTAFTAAVLPRASTGYQDAALRDALRQAALDGRMISAETTGDLDFAAVDAAGGVASDPRALQDAQHDLVAPETVDAAAKAFRAALHAPLSTDSRHQVYGVATGKQVDVPDKGLPRPTPTENPKVSLLAQQDLRDHARLAEGHWPSARVRHTGQGNLLVETVLTRRAAHTMHLATGDTFHVAQSLPGLHVTVRVAGVVMPEHRDAVYWKAEENLAEPTLVNKPTPLGEPQYHWEFCALLDRQAASALWQVDGGVRVFWHEPLALGSLAADDVPAMHRALASLVSGPDGVKASQAMGYGDLAVDETPSGVLDDYSATMASVRPLLLVAALGLCTAAAAVLVLWGMLAAERRREELALLRARGGSRTDLAVRLLAENALVAVPAALCGGALAWLATPGGPLLVPALWWAAACALAVLVLPVRAAVAHRDRRAGLRGRSRTSRPGLRRLIVEGTVLALVAAAVVTLRRRGVSAGGEADPLAAAVPVLLALGAAVLLLRLYPLPLRLLARPAARRSGSAAFLGLTLSSRARLAASAGLPLVAVLVALTVTGFGATVLSSVSTGRAEAATRTVGADARVESADPLPHALRDQLAAAPGVTDSTALRTHESGAVVNVLDPVLVAVVDAPSYARLAGRTGLGAFSAGELAEPDAHGAVPALVSPSVARQMGAGADVEAPGIRFRITPAVVRDATPAASGSDFVVVARSALQAARPDAGAIVRPDTVLLTGAHLDGRALRSTVEHADDAGSVALRAEVLATYSASKTQSGAVDLYRASAALAAGYAALAVLLSLLQRGPERRALLRRLTTLGMTRRARRAVLLLEALPLYLLIAVAGVATGLASVPLFGTGIDLAGLAGTPPTVPVPVGLDVLSLGVPAVALAVFATLILLAQTRTTLGTTTLREERA